MQNVTQRFVVHCSLVHVGALERTQSLAGRDLWSRELKVTRVVLDLSRGLIARMAGPAAGP
jgi:hypothetical protein